jgi:hypothetical protein
MVVGVMASICHSVGQVHWQFQQRNSLSITTKSCSTSGGGQKLEVAEIKERCEKWEWKGKYSINYFVSHSKNSNPPLLLVHGFGASIPHWRRLLFSPLLCFCYSASPTRYLSTPSPSIYLSIYLSNSSPPHNLRTTKIAINKGWHGYHVV